MKVRGLGCLAFGECVQGVYGFGSFEFEEAVCDLKFLGLTWI